MRNLSIDSLRAFVVTTDLGSVTNAADQLGRSQPATSLQIKKLEDAHYLLGKRADSLEIRMNKKINNWTKSKQRTGTKNAHCNQD